MFVVRGFSSHKPWRACAMHSHPEERRAGVVLLSHRRHLTRCLAQHRLLSSIRTYHDLGWEDLSRLEKPATGILKFFLQRGTGGRRQCSSFQRLPCRRELTHVHQVFGPSHPALRMVTPSHLRLEVGATTSVAGAYKVSSNNCPKKLLPTPISSVPKGPGKKRGTLFITAAR